MQILLAQLSLEQFTIGMTTRLPVVSKLQVFNVRRDPASVAPSIAVIAGPPILFRSRYHIGPDRIQFDIPVTGQQIAIVLHQACLMTDFPQGAGAIVFLVNVLRVTTARYLHRIGYRGFHRCRSKEMYVIGHF